MFDDFELAHAESSLRVLCRLAAVTPRTNGETGIREILQDNFSSWVRVAALHSSLTCSRCSVSPTKLVGLFLASKPFRDLGCPAHEWVIGSPRWTGHLRMGLEGR